jgi:hypothetical protein
MLYTINIHIFYLSIKIFENKKGTRISYIDSLLLHIQRMVGIAKAAETTQDPISHLGMWTLLGEGG